MSYVYDATTDKADVVILDCAGLHRRPGRDDHLPVRVPYGFHGNWIPTA